MTEKEYNKHNNRDEKEEDVMKKFLDRLMRWVCAYGRYGAGTPSCHGIFEAEVPNKLKE